LQREIGAKKKKKNLTKDWEEKERKWRGNTAEKSKEKRTGRKRQGELKCGGCTLTLEKWNKKPREGNCPWGEGGNQRRKGEKKPVAAEKMLINFYFKGGDKGGLEEPGRPREKKNARSPARRGGPGANQKKLNAYTLSLIRKKKKEEGATLKFPKRKPKRGEGPDSPQENIRKKANMGKGIPGKRISKEEGGTTNPLPLFKKKQLGLKRKKEQQFKASYFRTKPRFLEATGSKVSHAGILGTTKLTKKKKDKRGPSYRAQKEGAP